MAGGVGGGALAHAVCRVARRSQFSLGVLIRSREAAIVNRIRASLVDLDEISALLELLTDYLDQLLGIVGVIRVRQYVLRGVVADSVFVPAQSVDRISADSQPRPGEIAPLNRIANCGISRTRAFRPPIARGRRPVN